MHVFGLLLTPQIAVSYGFMFASSLADKCFCPKWERERKEMQRNAFSESMQRRSVRENVSDGGSMSSIYELT